MELREQFCKEYYDKNKNYLSKEQKRIEINPFYWKEYARWLETKLQKTAYNRDHAKSCPICGSKFLYVKTYKDKLGKYYCKECGYNFT